MTKKFISESEFIHTNADVIIECIQSKNWVQSFITMPQEMKYMGDDIYLVKFSEVWYIEFGRKLIVDFDGNYFSVSDKNLIELVAILVKLKLAKGRKNV